MPASCWHVIRIKWNKAGIPDPGCVATNASKGLDDNNGKWNARMIRIFQSYNAPGPSWIVEA